jgi:hypothetical protein
MSRTEMSHGIKNYNTRIICFPHTFPYISPTKRYTIVMTRFLMTLVNVILAIGIPSILACLIYIGRKLQVLDTVEKQIGDIYERFIKVVERVNTLWGSKVATSNSPRKLNDYGLKILKESGIKEIIEEKQNTLLPLVQAKGAKNAYDAEQAVLSIVEKLPEHCPDVIDRLKTGAFNAGATLDTVLLVGGLHLRDLIFPSLGFSVEEIDKHK